MTSIFLIAKILFAILIMFYLLVLTLKNKYIILYIIISVFAITTYEWITNQTIRISLQIIQLDMFDLLTIYLAVSALIINYTKDSVRFNYPKSIKLTLYFVLVVFLLSMFRGFFQNDFTYVIEDVRRLLESFFIPMLCFMYLPFNLKDAKVKKIIRNFSIGIVVYCIICWILDLGLGISVMPAQSDSGTTMRVFRAEQALIVALIAVYKVYSDLIQENRRYISIEGIALILVVVLLQHRSVWFSLAIGILYVLIKCIPIRKKGSNEIYISTKLLMQFVILIVLIPIFLFLFKDSELFVGLMAGIEGINAEEGSTLSYREQLWTAHLIGLNYIEWLVGKPFGSGYLIQLTNYSREITPHNAYIQTIIRSGVIGLLAVVTFVLTTILECSKRKSVWGLAFCLMVLVFWIPYTYNFFAGIAFAFVLKSLVNDN